LEGQCIGKGAFFVKKKALPAPVAAEMTRDRRLIAAGGRPQQPASAVPE